MTDWDNFIAWWAKNGPASVGETDFPAISFKMVAWSAWKARGEHERLTIIRECWDAIDSNIVRGELPGNGCDKSAQRNGMVLASNIVAELMGLAEGAICRGTPFWK